MCLTQDWPHNLLSENNIICVADASAAGARKSVSSTEELTLPTQGVQSNEFTAVVHRVGSLTLDPIPNQAVATSFHLDATSHPFDSGPVIATVDWRDGHGPQPATIINDHVIADLPNRPAGTSAPNRDYL